jgi:adenylate cyclase
VVTIRTLTAGFVAAIVVVGLGVLGALDSTELSALSHLFEIRGPRTPSVPIVIVSIDEDSFDELDLPWPFPRALHATLIDRISAARPLAIGVDVLFPEPSPRGAADDAALGAAVARAGNVVLAAAITTVSESFYVKTDLNAPMPSIRKGAVAVAPVSYTTDVDGNIRRSMLRHRLGNETLAGWDVAVYRLAAARRRDAAALPESDEIVINYRGRPRTFPWVPYHRVLTAAVPPETFRDAVVLIGATSPVLHDIFATPFARTGMMPGVEIHANAIDTLVRGDHIRPVPRVASLSLAVVAALGAAWLAARLRAVRAFVAVLLVWVALGAWTVLAFSLWNLWLQSVGIMFALVFGYGITVVDNYVREQRERRRLGQFFSPDVLREIVRHRDDVTLGSSRRVVTVLFSDIRGFTSISERLQPEQVAEMLGEYLTEMTDVVFRHGGTVDKYIGDCIMALYNAPFADPDHAANAIRTGLELQERTLAVSARWETRLGVQIRNGVGINTGEAVVGTMGSRQRLEYTAIGDTVNLASRLEGLTKEYGTGILISEDTYEQVKTRFLTRELGSVPVRGRSRPVKIYGVVPGEIRQYPRVVFAAAAVVVAEHSGQTCTVVTRDVGEGGLCVAGLPPQWTPGTRVRIRCEGGALAKPVGADGTIVWRRADTAGIAFTALDPDVAPAIADYVATRKRP